MIKKLYCIKIKNILTILLAITCLCPTASTVRAHSDVLNVLDYGATTGDQIDDTQAFQLALNTARESMKNVYAPAGSYWIAGKLNVPSGVTLTGSWKSPPSMTAGTILNIVGASGGEDAATITLEQNAGIKGVVISYPYQSPSAVPPIPYPWSIRGLGEDCKVENILFIRSYQGIDFGTYPCSRHYINNVFGSTLRRGIYIDGSIDVGRINNVHFSGWGIPNGNELDVWKKNNAEAFIIAKADWEWITNCFAFEVKVGFKFINGVGGNNKRTGPPNYVQIARSGIDITETPFLIETCSNLNFNECVFKGKASKILDSNVHDIRFSQCNFSPVPGTASLIEAKGKGRVSFIDCKFEYWDTGAAFAPALLADCGSILVQGCEFGTTNRPTFFPFNKQKVQIELTPNVKSAVVVENRLRYGQNIKNNATGSNIIVKDNVTDNLDGYTP